MQAGDRVLYVPNHAEGDRSHPDCEWGTISSFNSKGEPLTSKWLNWVGRALPPKYATCITYLALRAGKMSHDIF